jgi:probable blue pigment (indigoidine) exporter
MDLRAILMGLAFATMWSSAFTSARIIVQSAPPLMALSLRFFLSGLFAITLAYFMGQRIRLDRRQWASVVVFGISQNGLYLGLFFMAMQRIEASIAAIIASIMPLIVALFSVVFLKERLNRLTAVGLIAGFVGVAIIMVNRFQGGIDGIGLIYGVIGVLALSVATLMVRGASSGGNILMVIGLQMLVGSLALSLPALLFEDPTVVLSGTLIFAFTYTVVVPGLLATVVWFHLVKRIGATSAATFHFLNPFLGVATAAIILGEGLTRTDILGVAVIMVGILLVQKNRAAATEPGPSR